MNGRSRSSLVTMVWDAGGMQRLAGAPGRVAIPEVADPEGDLLHRRDGGLVAHLDRADPRDDRHRRVPDATTASSVTT